MLLFAIVATFSCKSIFNEILTEQQKLVALNITTQVSHISQDKALLEALIDRGEFSSIKISHHDQRPSLTYEDNSIGRIDSFLGKIQPSTLILENSALLIEYNAKNSTIITLIKKVLLIVYTLLILTSLIINFIYYKLLKNSETRLLEEIANDSDMDTPVGSFTKVTEQLHEQKRAFHQALQNQEKQIATLAHQVNMDNLTGLNNRHAFRKELTNILSNNENQQHAILSIIRASELNSINSQRGFQHGDEYIVNIATLINKVVHHHPSTSVYRISGSDFAIIARDMSIGDAQGIAKQLKIQFDQYQLLNKLDSMAYNGISSIISGQLPEQVLARTDAALAKAQTTGVNSWVFEQNDSDDSNQVGQQHWRGIIEDIVEKRRVVLLQQPIQEVNHGMKGYREIFTRFMGSNDAVIPTDTVFAMALRLDLNVKLEKLILETVFSKCRKMTENNIRWGVNLSSSTIQNSSFIIWLERFLLREPNIAASLIFEMQEVVLDSNLVASKRIFDMLKRTGSRSAICNFGKGIGSFRLFKELKPNFVKVDASLINNIARDSANQQFVRMIIDVAHRMDCRVIAEGIEHIEQKQVLENMYVDGIQGFLIARPIPT